MNPAVWAMLGVLGAAAISATALLRGGKIADKRNAANTAFSQLKEIVDRLDSEVKDLHTEVNKLRVRDLLWMQRDRKQTQQLLAAGEVVEALPPELK